MGGGDTQPLLTVFKIRIELFALSGDRDTKTHAQALVPGRAT